MSMSRGTLFTLLSTICDAAGAPAPAKNLTVGQIEDELKTARERLEAVTAQRANEPQPIRQAVPNPGPFNGFIGNLLSQTVLDEVLAGAGLRGPHVQSRALPLTAAEYAAIRVVELGDVENVFSFWIKPAAYKDSERLRRAWTTIVHHLTASPKWWCIKVYQTTNGDKLIYPYIQFTRQREGELRRDYLNATA